MSLCDPACPLVTFTWQSGGLIVQCLPLSAAPCSLAPSHLTITTSDNNNSISHSSSTAGLCPLSEKHLFRWLPISMQVLFCIIVSCQVAPFPGNNGIVSFTYNSLFFRTHSLARCLSGSSLSTTNSDHGYIKCPSCGDSLSRCDISPALFIGRLVCDNNNSSE